MTGRIFYVDSAEGCDENCGTEEKKPWKSLEKVNSLYLRPGDEIRFKRGGK